MSELMPSAKAASWITTRHLRAHGLILALCLWSVYLWNIATPGLLDRAGNLKGTDFLHFYTLGSLALEHDGGDLYDMRAQEQLAAQRVPAAAGIRYLPLYPPQVSMLFAGFACLSYPWALAVWLCFSALLYFSCCYAVWRICPNLRDEGLTVSILALAFPAFWHLILWGQTSALALACFTLAFLALRGEHEWLAGIALGALIFKPQFGLAAAIIFLFTLHWRILAGATLSALGELSVGLFYYGRGPIQAWILALRDLPGRLQLLEPRIYQTHSLRSFWAMLIPWFSASLSIYIVSAVLICTLAVSCWRRSTFPLSLRYSSLLLATVLVAPHLTVYDLVILAPVFLLLADWMIARANRDSLVYLKILLYLSFVLPMIGPIAEFVHIQLSVPAMAGLLYGIWAQRQKTELV